MKGTQFQRPLEFGLEVQGETWQQGEPLQGSLTVRNHGPDPFALQDLQDLQVTLARGRLSQVRARKPDSFDVQESHPCGSGESIPKGGQMRFEWKLALDPNAQVTDNVSSLFLLYGAASNVDKLGQLQLNVVPRQLIRDLIELIKVEHRFVEKSIRAAKGEVEIKFDPPEAKVFSVVEALSLFARLEGENLELRYVATVKKIDPTAGMSVTPQKREIEQVLEPAQYRIASGRFNNEAMAAAFKSVLDQLGLGSPL